MFAGRCEPKETFLITGDHANNKKLYSNIFDLAFSIKNLLKESMNCGFRRYSNHTTILSISFLFLFYQIQAFLWFRPLV